MNTLAVLAQAPLWRQELQSVYEALGGSVWPLVLFGVSAAMGLARVVSNRLKRSTLCVFAASILFLAGVFVLRWIVSGRAWYLPPVMNQYEAMLASALLGCIVAMVLELRWRNGVALLASSLYAVMILLACRLVDGSLADHPGILDSPLMAMHVAIIIIGHAVAGMTLLLSYPYLFAVIWRSPGWPAKASVIAFQVAVIPGLIGWPALAFANPELRDVCATFAGATYLIAVAGMGALAFVTVSPRTDSAMLAGMDRANIILARIGCFAITLGTILGAAWGDVAWGRWWGWDPKETWALITIVLLLIALHVRPIAGERRGLITAVFCLLAAGAMLVNWIVVNYLLAGLHSYA
ncbi:MAG: cytochrome c biogenesis protein CcsA [Planctomycetes bacterium]|nr:cytochrome c biogenesis protein CcsA [Planctomycetota bacterium]